MMFDITEVVIAIIGLVSALITVFLIPYIKSKTSQQQLDMIYSWADIAVESAEQIIGSGRGAEKKKMVKDFLLSKNLIYDEEAIDRIIESSVRTLKMRGGEVK